MVIPVLKTGCLAYIDSTTEGLVPVKVLGVRALPNRLAAKPFIEVRYEVTETRGAYPKGHVDTLDDRLIVPRSAIQKRQFHPTIGPYTVEVDQ